MSETWKILDPTVQPVLEHQLEINRHTFLVVVPVALVWLQQQ